jgi:hypothetical protein
MAPPHARQQRRRAQQRRPSQVARAPQPRLEDTLATSTLPADEPLPAAPRPAVRRSARPAPAPIDYSQDYADARHDLRRIAIIAAVLLAGMIALAFSGLV